MIRIDVNGVMVEGETLEVAAKLAKKEEKKQAKERKATSAVQQKAETQAYAAIGKLASIRVYPKDIVTDPSTIKSLIFRANFPLSLYIESMNGETAWQELSETEHVTAIYCYASGILAVRLSRYSDLDEKCSIWNVYGVADGYIACLTLPYSLSDALEALIDEQEEQQAA